MIDNGLRIFPLGDSALSVEFGNRLSHSLNKKAIDLAAHFDCHPFPGYIESVPAYASATLFYDLIAVRKAFPDFPTAFDAVRSIAEAVVNTPDGSGAEMVRRIEIPVHFDTDSALDLELIAERAGISRAEAIELFTAREYRVYMLGFLPGFTYMGDVDDRIATPRKDAPRLSVPRGSIGIAGKQTGIYSLESPGGWQIIGRTDVEMYIPKAESPTYLQPGDIVKFVAVR